jgi:hypothetical protein
VIIKATGKVDRVEDLALKHIADENAGAFGNEVNTQAKRRCLIYADNSACADRNITERVTLINF